MKKYIHLFLVSVFLSCSYAHATSALDQVTGHYRKASGYANSWKINQSESESRLKRMCVVSGALCVVPPIGLLAFLINSNDICSEREQIKSYKRLGKRYDSESLTFEPTLELLEEVEKAYEDFSSNGHNNLDTSQYSRNLVQMYYQTKTDSLNFTQFILKFRSYSQDGMDNIFALGASKMDVKDGRDFSAKTKTYLIKKFKEEPVSDIRLLARSAQVNPRVDRFPECPPPAYSASEVAPPPYSEMQASSPAVSDRHARELPILYLPRLAPDYLSDRYGSSALSGN